nr:protein LURP-one-related 10-like [Tanacetum cinerariifolium]
MAQPSNIPLSLPVSVIGSQFVAPHPLEVIVEIFSSGNIVITDTDNKIILKVKPCDSSFHLQRLLVDPYDRPLVLLREKNLSEHKRWEVFRGDSKTDSNLIFSTKTKHMIQSKTHVNVFLANKTSDKDYCDFKIEGSWSKRNCSIHMRGSSSPIAQIHTYQPIENAQLAKGKFMVTIYPSVDHAFVVALIAILDGMKNSDSTDQVAGAVTEQVAGSVTGSLVEALFAS